MSLVALATSAVVIGAVLPPRSFPAVLLKPVRCLSGPRHESLCVLRGRVRSVFGNALLPSLSYRNTRECVSGSCVCKSSSSRGAIWPGRSFDRRETLSSPDGLVCQT